jgi:hypothetical protein
MDAEAWQDLEPLEPSTEPEDPSAHRRTLLQMLEDRSDAEVTALPADRLACDLDFLLEALVEEVAQHQVAEAHLREAAHHQRLAAKHEDADEVYWTTVQLDHFQRVVPRYAAQCRRYWQQWRRHWAALLKHRLPDALYDALETIAATEHRTLHEQIAQLLREGVARWQAQHPHTALRKDALWR